MNFYLSVLKERKAGVLTKQWQIWLINFLSNQNCIWLPVGLPVLPTHLHELILPCTMQTRPQLYRQASLNKLLMGYSAIYTADAFWGQWLGLKGDSLVFNLEDIHVLESTLFVKCHWFSDVWTHLKNGRPSTSEVDGHMVKMTKSDRPCSKPAITQNLFSE